MTDDTPPTPGFDRRPQTGANEILERSRQVQATSAALREKSEGLSRQSAEIRKEMKRLLNPPRLPTP